MIRNIENKDIDKIMDIWLRSTIKAHDFISKEYWENIYNIVKDEYIPMVETFIYEAVVEGNLVTSPSWPGNTAIVREFSKLLGAKIEI